MAKPYILDAGPALKSNGAGPATDSKSSVSVGTKGSGVAGGPTTLDFHYIKSPMFHSVFADGAIGSITPKRNIHAALYTERPAIPQMETRKIAADGSLGDRVSVTSRAGFVRELQVDLIIDKHTARELAKWLNERADDLEKIEKKLRPSKSKRMGKRRGK